MPFEPSASQAPRHATEHPRSEIVRLHQRDSAVNVSQNERGASLLGGVALLGIAVVRRGWAGAALGAFGSVLVVRGATGRCPVYRSLGIRTEGGQMSREVELTRAITIQAPLEKVRGFFLDAVQVGRVARFLEVNADGPDRWTVAAQLPQLGRRSEWDMTVVQEKDRIELRSGPGAPFEHTVRIELEPAPGDRGTEAIVTVCATPPGGLAGVMVGRWLARLLEPGLGAQLAKVKQQIETGEVATVGNVPSGRRSPMRRVASRVIRVQEASA